MIFVIVTAPTIRFQSIQVADRDRAEAEQARG
jgi:hypothetical protein